MIVDGVKITTNLRDLTAEEAQRYVDYVRERVTDTVTEIDVRESSDGGVDVSYVARGEKFERIRRVTGYLVGALDRWNDAKQAEERERVKHDVGRW